MNISLDVMHSKPGIYAVVTSSGMSWVEVAQEGKCWQLRFDDFARDGELIPGRWLPQHIHAIVGPLVRPDVAERKLSMIFNHWNEFGPLHGFSELMDRLQK